MRKTVRKDETYEQLRNIVNIVQKREQIRELRIIRIEE